MTVSVVVVLATVVTEVTVTVEVEVGAVEVAPETPKQEHALL